MSTAAESTQAKLKTMPGSASGTADEVNAIKQKFKAYRKAHFRKNTVAKKKYRLIRNIRQVEIDSDNTDSESNSEFKIVMLTNGQNKSNIFAKMLLVNARKTLKFQLDSGATANLIPKKVCATYSLYENA